MWNVITVSLRQRIVPDAPARPGQRRLPPGGVGDDAARRRPRRRRRRPVSIRAVFWACRRPQPPLPADPARPGERRRDRRRRGGASRTPARRCRSGYGHRAPAPGRSPVAVGAVVVVGAGVGGIAVATANAGRRTDREPSGDRPRLRPALRRSWTRRGRRRRRGCAPDPVGAARGPSALALDPLRPGRGVPRRARAVASSSSTTAASTASVVLDLSDDTQRRGRRRSARPRRRSRRRLAVRVPDDRAQDDVVTAYPLDDRGRPDAARRGRSSSRSTTRPRRRTTAAPSASVPTASCTPGSATAAGSATRAGTPRTGRRCSARSSASTRRPARPSPYRVPADNPFVGRDRLAARRSGSSGSATRSASPSTPRPATCGSATSASRAGRSSTCSGRRRRRQPRLGPPRGHDRLRGRRRPRPVASSPCTPTAIAAGTAPWSRESSCDDAGAGDAAVARRLDPLHRLLQRADHGVPPGRRWRSHRSSSTPGPASSARSRSRRARRRRLGPLPRGPRVPARGADP